MNKRLKNITIILIIFFIIFFIIWQIVYDPFQPLMSAEDKATYLRLIEKMDHIFKKNNINYFLAYGTLLGAIRHKGFIPWDDDFDIFVDKSDKYKLLNSIKNELDINNMNILPGKKSNPLYYKLFFKDSYSIKGSNYKWPFIDIFFYYEKDNEIIFNDVNKIRSYSKNYFNLFPIKRCKFENIYLNCPNNSIQLLKNSFGNNFLNMAVSHKYNHKYEKIILKRYLSFKRTKRLKYYNKYNNII